MDPKDTFLQQTISTLHDDITEVKTDVRQIRDTVNEIHATTAVNTRVLDEHMRRTEIAEKRLEVVETEVHNFHTIARTILHIGAFIASALVFFSEILPLIQSLFSH